MITGANRNERISTGAPCHKCCHNPHVALKAELSVGESLITGAMASTTYDFG